MKSLISFIDEGAEDKTEKYKVVVLTRQPKDKPEQKLLATGAAGQVVAEAGVFTAPDVFKVISDDHFTMKDLIRNYAVNVGMMGILKVKSKLIKDGIEEARKIKNDLISDAKKEKDLFENMKKS